MQQQSKPYQATKKGSITNWYEELEKLSKINLDTCKDDKEYQRIKGLSSNWVTCACGNQCDIIPRDYIGTPIDQELRELGMDFYRQVRAVYVDRAYETLAKIEKRSEELIKNILKNERS